MKVTKKLLSVFLAFLMAMSCCVAAFPTIADAAVAGSTDIAKLNSLLQYAINTGEITSYSTSQSGLTKTITDNSAHGVIFDASKYIMAVANTYLTTGDSTTNNYHT